MNNTTRAIKSLEIEDVKIYEVIGDKGSVLTRGKLEIFYIPEFDRFMLDLNSFRYLLSPNLPVMASLFEERAFRSYVLPYISGHYIMKLKTIPTPAVIKNLETIFANYSQFSYKTGQELQLQNQANRQGEFETHPQGIVNQNVPNQQENLVKASKYIRTGGEILKQNIIKAANYVGKSWIEPKGTLNQSPSQNFVTNIDELRGLNAPSTSFVEVRKSEISALVTLNEQIEKGTLGNFEQYQDIKLSPTQTVGGWPMLKKTAVDSGISLWQGTNEAFTILSKAVKDKRALKKPKDNKHITFERVVQVERKPEVNMPKPEADIPVTMQRQEEIQSVQQQETVPSLYPALSGPYSVNQHGYMQQTNRNDFVPLIEENSFSSESIQQQEIHHLPPSAQQNIIQNGNPQFINSNNYAPMG